MNATERARLIACVVARELKDGEIVAFGLHAELMLAAALVAQRTHAPDLIIRHGLRVERGAELGPSAWTDDRKSRTHELIEYREEHDAILSVANPESPMRFCDVFFVGGMQIDREGSTNLIGIKGDDGRVKVRGPGSIGTTSIGTMASRVILFSGDHTPRRFVERVDFVSVPGWRRRAAAGLAQPIELELMRGSDRNRGTYRGVESRYLKYAHASANGRVIAVGETILLLNDMTYERRLSPRLFRSSGVRKEKDYGMRPNTDGSLIYAPLALYSINMARKESHRHGENLLIPATQPGFCVSVTGHYSRKGSTGVALCLEGESTPFAELKQVDVSLNRLPPDRVFSFTGMAYTKRYTLVPDARLLIQIPTGEDRLILHKVNPELLLKQSDHNYLYVTSGSLSEAHLGKPWQHQIEVQSKQGGVKYQVSYGPKGMVVSPTGLITWTPPEDFASPEEGTVFNVQDQSGKSIMHSVKVSIPGAAENAARRAEEQLAQFKAVKEAQERQAKERRSQEMEKQKQRQLQKPAQSRMRRTPTRQPRAVTTEYAVKVGPIAKAKAEANARAQLQQQIEKLNQQKLNLRTRAWTDQKGNQFEAQLTRVFAGNGYFSTPVMKRYAPRSARLREGRRPRGPRRPGSLR